ncbi:hypothetical protein [Stutzerimonas nitrititolerans]|uniref:hypothetical protein n=1 Tax=Stutzerimonas nitrititolerans TaxID=2482751 RepID=UPI0028A9825A|nr:hypothetical protein [Stutzerimonas nitrititolerans]
MLRCYPISATQENWLHDAVTGLIHAVHQKIEAGEPIKNTQTAWLELIEDTENIDNKDTIKKFTGMRKHLFSYKDEILNLTPQQRDSILDAMSNQNSIEELLNGTIQPKLINTSHPSAHEKAKNLFVFCFEKLTELRIRERQYKTIFDSLPEKICPFCGIDRVMNPEETAQDQDHYLAKSIYPFAATNMRNLVPMCRCCNRDYKKDANVIMGTNGTQRTAFDPYNCTPPEISLNPSTLIQESSPIKFHWEIEFLSEVENSETWDSIFSIRERYKRDVLNQYFDRWLRGFTVRCSKDRNCGNIRPDFTDAQIREQLQNYQEYKAENPSIGLAGFLEPLAFKLLLRMYDEGEERILNLIRDAVLGVSIDDL